MKNVRWLILCGLLPVLAACGGGSECSFLGDTVCGSSSKVVNVAPVANAGASQSVLLYGGAVQLDGSGSTDANGDALTYLWTLSRPLGSVAVLTGATSSNPRFTPDVKGVYTASLVVDDGKIKSVASSVLVIVSEVNAPPVANAGPDQNVVLGSVVTLDGRDSTDANSADQLTFVWALSTPDGSSQTLTGVKPTFTANLTGVYTASLTVSDGAVSSAIDTVRVQVSTANVVPVAVISALSSVNTGSVVQLNGLSSTDANADPLSYQWALLSKPLLTTGATANSSAVLSNVAILDPVFTADVAGVYVLSLVVSDGKASSNPATWVVTATTGNLPPVANAGFDQVVAVATTVTLNGSGSRDANGDTLSYQWALTGKPNLSAAVLTGASTATPTFRADLAGFYMATLTVSDGKGGIHVSRVLIEAL
jgi:hypothetical protein